MFRLILALYHASNTMPIGLFYVKLTEESNYSLVIAIDCVLSMKISLYLTPIKIVIVRVTRLHFLVMTDERKLTRLYISALIQLKHTPKLILASVVLFRLC